MNFRTIYKIIFHNSPRGIFYTGDTISGTLIVTTKIKKCLQSVKLALVCRGQVREIATKDDDDYNEIFFEKSQFLLNNNQGTWEPGEYVFHFQGKIAKGLPPTFYGTYGYIIHEIVVSLVDGFNNPDNTTKIPFAVLQSDAIFLKEKSLFTKYPRKYMKEGNVCYCCFILRRPFKVIVKSPSNVLKPGEQLNLFVVTVSKAKDRLWRLELQLIKKFKYHYKERSEIDRRVIASTLIKDQNSMVGERFSIGLIVPPTEPTSFSGGKLVTISYIAKVMLELETLCDRPIELEIPVTIGVGNIDFTKEIYPTKFGRQISLRAPIVKIESVENFQAIPEISDFPSYFHRQLYYPPSTDLSLRASTKTHLSRSSENISMLARSLTRTNSDPCIISIPKGSLTSEDAFQTGRRTRHKTIVNQNSPTWTQTKVDFLESVFPSRCQSKSEQGI